jgi:predicted nucleotidyltransferase component of viral defense system
LTRKSPANLAESVRQRLLNLARHKGEDFQVTLNNYFLERFLYRLSHSEANNRFVLKGALLLRLWTEHPYRATLDLDLLRRGGSDREAVASDIRAICATAVEPDGVEFDVRDLTLEPIREDQEYAGLRSGFTAKLGTARMRLQVDIGVGDAVWPDPREQAYPAMLEFPAPHVLTYSREAVVAEKFEAMVVLGARNSRIKDFFDIHYLATQFSFDGAELAEAIRRTFARRKTPLPEEIPVGLTEEYWKQAGRNAQLRAFVRRARMDAASQSVSGIAPMLRTFLLPPWEALRDSEPFARHWPTGGPWAARP